MDYPIHINKISMLLFILYFCTSQNFNKMMCFSPFKIVRILTNSADPDEMPPDVAFHLGDSLQKMSVLYAANERVSRLNCYLLVTTFVIC